MTKCNNEVCGYSTPKPLEICPRCGGALEHDEKKKGKKAE